MMKWGMLIKFVDDLSALGRIELEFTIILTSEKRL